MSSTDSYHSTYNFLIFGKIIFYVLEINNNYWVLETPGSHVLETLQN